MLFDLQQFVPSRVCLSCDGCCRFKEKESAWRPHVTGDEKSAFKKEDLDATGRVKTIGCVHDGRHPCSFLEVSTGACRVYQHRPFECQLYPFVLTKKNGQTTLAVHLPCPYIQEKNRTMEFEEHVGFLKIYFQRKDVLDFLKKNPALAGEYPGCEDELETLFTVL